jgi:hypothetical protein
MFLRSRRKIVVIKRVRWSHSKESGKLRNGGSGNWGRFPNLPFT